MWVHSGTDNSYSIGTESGFSGHLLRAIDTSTPVVPASTADPPLPGSDPLGCHVDLEGDQDILSTGWTEVTMWRDQGVAGLWNTGQFDLVLGRCQQNIT